jgi:DNA-directed RNA polymerase subunit omega
MEATSLIRPSLEELIPMADSRYTLVVMAAKRARTIMNVQQKRGGNLAEKPVTRALREIADGQIDFYRPAPGEIEETVDDFRMPDASVGTGDGPLADLFAQLGGSSDGR